MPFWSRFRGEKQAVLSLADDGFGETRRQSIRSRGYRGDFRDQARRSSLVGVDQVTAVFVGSEWTGLTVRRGYVDGGAGAGDVDGCFYHYYEGTQAGSLLRFAKSASADGRGPATAMCSKVACEGATPSTN